MEDSPTVKLAEIRAEAILNAVNKQNNLQRYLDEHLSFGLGWRFRTNF